MDAAKLRLWGIVTGSAAMLGALALGMAPDAEAPRSMFAPAAAAPMQSAPAAAAAPVSFLVRIEGSGPLGRAQALAARGNVAQATRNAAAALARQRAFSGLCLDRFTVGGAEMVLRTCEPVAAAERAQTSARWLARLRDMRAVAYADINSSAAPARGQ